MPIGNIGGHVPGSEELAQILNGMGVGQTAPQTGTEKVISKAAVNRETKDTVSRYDSENQSAEWGLEGAGEPVLPEPDREKEAEWKNFSIGGDISAAVKAAGMPPVQETLGVKIESEKMVQLADNQPLARYCIATMGEGELTKRLEAYFEAEGTGMPQHPASPSYRAAISESLEQYLVDTGSFLPDELTMQLEGGMDVLKTITDYMAYLQGIDAPEKSYNTGPGVQKTIDMMEENLVLINTALEVLKEGDISNEDKVSMSDFMKFIGDILALVKKTLIQAQLMDTKKSSEKAAAEREVIKLRGEMAEKKFHAQMAMMGLDKAMKMFNKVMRILMPCISAVIILFSLFFLPFAPIVTLIMVGVALSMIALQVSLSETGAMEDMFDGINSVVDEVANAILPGTGDIGTLLVWLAIIAAALLIAVLLTMCPMVGVAIPAIIGPIISWCVQYSGIGEQIGEYFVEWTGTDDQIGQAILKGLGSMIFSITTALCLSIAALLREAITQLIKEAIKLVFQLCVELIKMLIGIITIVFQLLVAAIQIGVSLVQAAGQLLTQVGNLAIKSLTDLVDLVMEIVIKVIALLMKIVSAFMESIAKGLQVLMEQVVKILTKVFDVLKETVLKLLESLRDMIIEIFTKILDKAADVIIKAMEMIVQLVKQVMSLIENLIKSLVQELSKMFLEGIKQSLSIMASLQRGGFKMYEARMVEIVGMMDVIIELLGDLQKMLKNSLNKALSQTNEQGVGDFMEVVNQLSKLFEQMISNYSDIGTGISRAGLT